MQVLHKLTMDLSDGWTIPVIRVVQNDSNTRAVEMSLLNNSDPWKIPNGITATVGYRKPNGTVGSYSALSNGKSAVSLSGSTLTAILASQMLDTPGVVQAVVTLQDTSTNQLSSFPFNIQVQKNPALDGASDEESGGPTLQSKTVTPSESKQVVSPDTGYDGLSQVTVQAVSSTYIGSSVTKKAAATYTPGTADQTIASGQYLSGKQTIKGDANLVAENIKSGVSVFGVGGAYVGTVDIDTSDATANAEDIAKGKTAYVNGMKVTGTHECAEGLDTSDATATSEDMAEGKTAYVNGEKITGAIPLWSGWSWNSATPSWDSENSKLQLKGIAGARRFIEKDAAVIMRCDPSNLGDATAEDVAAGKTFTSAAGLKVTGTLEAAAAGTGLSVKTGETTSAVFDVGLSELKALLLYTSTRNRVGLVNAAYIAWSKKGIVSGVSDYSYFASYSFYSDTYRYFTFADGIVTWNTDGTTSSFVEGNTYTWVAVGIE